MKTQNFRIPNNPIDTTVAAGDSDFDVGSPPTVVSRLAGRLLTGICVFSDRFQGSAQGARRPARCAHNIR